MAGHGLPWSARALSGHRRALHTLSAPRLPYSFKVSFWPGVQAHVSLRTTPPPHACL